MAALKRLAAALLLSASSVAAQQSTDVLNAIKTLDQMQLIANALELQKSATKTLQAAPNLTDGWGTPLRIETVGTTYRIASAGADRKFDEKSWSEAAQFTGVEGDLVLANGLMVRSNRYWLTERATDAASAAALKELRRDEVMFMVSRTPLVTNISLTSITTETMLGVASNIDRYRAAAAAPPVDGWNTPMRLTFDGENYRLVSAGADREFQQDRWDAAEPARNFEEDIVLRNGTFARQLDVRAYYEAAAPVDVRAVPQPAHPRLPRGGGWLSSEDDGEKPVIVTRVNPEYPEDYRLARIRGIVIVEVAIDTAGVVQDVAVLKSLGAEMDLATIRAVRQWTFQPAKQNGKPVPYVHALTVNFQLQ